MRFALCVCSFVVALSLLAGEARAQNDLTGTYVGTMKCKEVDAVGAKDSNKLILILHASQPAASATGADLQLFTQVIDAGTGVPLGQYFWFGRTIFNAKNPTSKGVGSFGECTHVGGPGAGVDYQTAQFRYTVNRSDGKASIKFKTMGDMAGGDGSIGACSGKVKMVSAIDPSIPLCP